MEPTDRLSPHFTLAELVRSELALRHAVDNTAPPGVVANLARLAATLEQVRALAGAPLLVSSGYRCLAVNRLLGSSDTSAHVLGLAADFTAPGWTVTALARAIAHSGIEFDQLIDEHGWVHLGLASGTPRRQLLTAVFVPGRPTRYQAGLV
jgi:hypothetical protein